MDADPYLSVFLIADILQPFTLATGVAICVIILLLIISALVSGSEVAMFALTPSDVHSLKSGSSEQEKTLLKLIQDPDKLLATILIANNFVNVAIVMLSAYITTSLFDFSSVQVIGFVVQVVVVTFLLLLFGEIMPKVLASSKAYQFALRMTYPLNFLSKLFSPFSRFLVTSTSIVNRGLSKKTGNLSMDDLSTALQLTSDEIEEDKEILEGIIKFGNISVVEIMTARVDVMDINIQSDFNKVISLIIESGFSRLPVYHNSPDNIKGVLYIKDLIPHRQKGPTFRWQSLIRPAYFVPETKKISVLLEEFQTNKIHLAVVIDEYGGTSGIITMEDILEEIVGEISDEFDADSSLYELDPKGNMIFEGKIQLNDFYKVTELDETIFQEIKGDADSLAGLLLEVKGDMPSKYEEIKVEGIRFQVLAVDDRRIKKIKFIGPVNEKK